ncbi:hypothetical protein D3C72_1696680 [compost metagenome]
MGLHATLFFLNKPFDHIDVGILHLEAQTRTRCAFWSRNYFFRSHSVFHVLNHFDLVIEGRNNERFFSCRRLAEEVDFFFKSL